LFVEHRIFRPVRLMLFSFYAFGRGTVDFIYGWLLACFICLFILKYAILIACIDRSIAVFLITHFVFNVLMQFFLSIDVVLKK
jgi:hypothetical protein